MKYAQMSGGLKVKLLVTLPVGHGGRALERRPATAMQSALPNFWDAARVSADGAYPISVNPGWEGQKVPQADSIRRRYWLAPRSRERDSQIWLD